MADCNKFEPLRDLSDEVRTEVIREAEARLVAQLQIATAADQRALTLAGFQIASATAALAGGVALSLRIPSDIWLAVISLLFALTLVIMAGLSVSAVRPTKFDIPGNRPFNWLPDNWQNGKAHDFSLSQAQIEQAACLDGAILDNTAIMDKAAGRVRRSIDYTIAAVATAAVLLLGTLIYRHSTIREPNSEVVFRPTMATTSSATSASR